MIRLCWTQKSTGTGVHESTIIAPLHRRYMQCRRPRCVEPSTDRSIDRPAGCRLALYCACALARAGRLHAAELAPRPVEARGSSATQKIHPRFIHRPAGIFP